MSVTGSWVLLVCVQNERSFLEQAGERQPAAMGGCRGMDMWQLPSLVSREGVSSFALLLRGAGQHY